MLLVLSLTACGKKNKSHETETETETETIEATETTDEEETTKATDTAANDMTEGETTEPATETTPTYSVENTGGNQNDTPAYTPPPSNTTPTTPTQPSQTTSCSHSNTYTKGFEPSTEASEGYTGDLCCLDCGKLLQKGEKTPKFIHEYTIEDPVTGKSFTYKKGEVESLLLSTLKKATRNVSHQHEIAEKEVFRLVNVERQNAGLSPVEWLEDAYYFTKIRADECHINYSHYRPNGAYYNNVYWENDVAAFDVYENLYGDYNPVDDEKEEAAWLMEGWMNSSGHRKNILMPSHKYLTVSITEKNGEWTAIQHFFDIVD